MSDSVLGSVARKLAALTGMASANAGAARSAKSGASSGTPAAAGARDAAEVATEKPRPAATVAPRSGRDAQDLAHGAKRRQQHAQLSGVVSLRQGTDGPAVTVVRSYPAGEKYGHITEFSLEKPMTRAQVLRYLYDDGKLPRASDRQVFSEFSRDPALVSRGPGKGPSRNWKLNLTNVNKDTSRMRPQAFQALFGEAVGSPGNRHQGSPPGTPVYSAELLERSSPPVVGDPKLAFVVKSGDVTVWKEDKTLFWFDQKTGSYEGIELRDGSDRAIYNKDIEHYMTKEFLAPSKAVRKYVAQWKHINRSMLGAYGFALGGTFGTNTGGALNPISLDDAVVDAARGGK